MFKRIPNILTMIRFFLIPAIVVLIVKQNYLGAMIVLTVSGITDILDGFIARKFNLITDFGKLADPLADKATQVAILVTLSIKGILPLWILLAVIVKEFVLVSGASFLYGKELVVSSKWYGKLATVLFYIAIVASLFIRYWNMFIATKYSLTTLPMFDEYIYYPAIVATFFSLVMYIKAFYLQGYLKKKE